MSTYKAIQCTKPGSKLELVTRTIPEPKEGQVLIKVEACGVCHSDSLMIEGEYEGLTYPRVPGHEVIGRIAKLGPGVNPDFWKIDERVGMGWHGGHCFNCDRCRRGDFVTCKNAKITGFHHDGGFAEYIVSPWEAMARVPDELSSEDAAPLMCAGITVFNSIRNAGALPGETVAIVGIGGLGHLAIQYCNKMGYKVVAISGGDDKKEVSTKLGAHIYIDYKTQDPAAELKSMGGAKIIAMTASEGDSSEYVKALGVGGKLLMLGVGAKINVKSEQLIQTRSNIGGWPTGIPIESEDTLNFSALTGVKPVIEKFDLEQANEAYKRMVDGESKFRGVLLMKN